MTDEEITKVVKKLVGSVYPTGDTNHDAKVFDNITLLLNVVDALVCNVGNNVIEGSSYYASIARCKGRMTDMFKTIKTHIDEYLEEEKQQPKRGKWISVDATHSKCEKCEAIFEITSPNAEVNFCPSCGVLLESEMQI